MAKPASSNRVKKRPAPAMIGEQLNAGYPMHAAKIHKYLQDLVPQRPIPMDEMEANLSHNLIKEFVSIFAFNEGRAELYLKPETSILESLAERFLRYLKGETLDEAFDLTTIKKRGKRNLKTKDLIRTKTIKARALYDELRSKKMPAKKAKSEVARALKCSEDEIHTLLFRKLDGRA